MFFTFVPVYVSLFVCLFVHKCVVVQLSVNYGIKCLCKRPQSMKAHIFLNFIFLLIREKDEVYLSLESVTSIKNLKTH